MTVLARLRGWSTSVPLLSACAAAKLRAMAPDDEVDDRYAPTPAVLGDDGPPAPPSAPAAATGPFAYPERWGVPGLGAVIPTALRLWKRTLGPTINLGLIAAIGTAFPTILDRFAATDPSLEEGPAWALSLLIQVLVGLPLTVICGAAANFAAADELAFGRQRHGLGALLRHGARFFWTYLGANIMIGLPIVLLVAPGAVAWAAGVKAVAVALFALLGVLALLLLARWAVFGQAIFFEGSGAWSSRDRSRALVDGAVWPVLGLYLLQLVVVVTVEEGAPALAALFGPIPSALVALAAQVFALGFGAVWTFALYAALRDRELARERSEGRASPAPTPP